MLRYCAPVAYEPTEQILGYASATSNQGSLNRSLGRQSPRSAVLQFPAPKINGPLFSSHRFRAEQDSSESESAWARSLHTRECAPA